MLNYSVCQYYNVLHVSYAYYTLIYNDLVHTPIVESAPCPLIAHSSDPTKYYNGGVLMVCSGGTTFMAEKCACDGIGLLKVAILRLYTDES